MTGRATRVVWPPRLTGVLFDAPRPYSGQAYLALDNLTVLFGANGAGKTTTLRLLEQELPRLDRVERLSDELIKADCTFFVEVTDEQLAVLTAEALASQADSEGVAWPWPGGPWSSEDATSTTTSEEPVERWLSVLGAHADAGGPELSKSLKQLSDSRTVAVRRSTKDGYLELAWCSPLVGTRPKDNNGLNDVLVDGALAPAPAAPLGRTKHTMLPTAVSVPRPIDEIRVELREAVVDILIHLRWGERDRWARSRGVPPPERETRRGTKAWLEAPESEVASVHPMAKALVSLASQIASSLAPSFVSAAHEILIVIEPIHEWESGGPRLRLQLAVGDTRYPLRRAADGHKVWLQLALLETVAILRRYLDVLDHLLDRAVEAEALAGSNLEVQERRQYRTAVELLRAFEKSPVGQDSRLAQFEALRNGGHRLYLIDEPEQHLHPRLQRAATTWLADAGTAGASQCVVVTHSPHYLRIPGRVSFAYLQSTADSDGRTRSHIRVLTPELIAASDAVAGEMGFDRGELLSGVGLVVFVEGQADKAFLENLYGQRLHHAGIALVPIHGAVAAQRKGVVDSELVLVWTAAKVAVLLDNLIEQEWKELVADAEHCRRQARKSSKTEVQAMAAVLQRARELGRDIAPVGIPVPDIFDLLDEGVLKTRFEKFPGHELARAEWATACEKQQINWKTFYRDRYGIEVEPALFAEVGASMAREQIRPDECEDLVVRLEGLAA